MKHNINRASLVILAICTLCFGSPQTSLAKSPLSRSGLTPDERNNIEVFTKVHPSVVFVTTSKIRRIPFTLNIQKIPAGTGTGFIWDRSGLIVTNFHVIQGADAVQITLSDQTSYNAKIVGIAPGKDLALLKINAPKEKLIPIEQGDSTTLQVGRKVLAIGNPFGLDATLTVGVISALDREIKGFGNRIIKGVIQTDAAINPGNSGGPLLNSQGQLVGINAQIISPSGASSGIGFAIPVQIVKTIIPQLQQFGRVMRPVLGIHTLSDSISRRYGIKGLVVAQVTPGGPAAKAGLHGLSRDQLGVPHLGDVIIGIDHKPALNQDMLLSALEKHKAGDVISLKIFRQNKTIIVKLTLAAP